jgi:hypothetical protein
MAMNCLWQFFIYIY